MEVLDIVLPAPKTRKLKNLRCLSCRRSIGDNEKRMSGLCEKCYTKAYAGRQAKPCTACGTREGGLTLRGKTYRKFGLCQECTLKNRTCLACGTKQGEIRPNGLPKRYNGYCLRCWEELKETKKKERSERTDDRYRKIDVELEKQIILKELGGYYHCPELKKTRTARRGFSTRKLVKEYRQAMRRIKTGWCCDLKTGKLQTSPKMLAQEEK